MCYLLIAILIGNNIFATQTPATLQQVLGQEKVRSILNKVIMRKIESFSKSYVITEQALDQVRSVGVPGDTLNKLEVIKGKEIQGEQKFQVALIETLGQQDSIKYESVISSNARGYLIVKDDFLRTLEELVLNTAAPDTGDREKWLENGFDKFLSDYLNFVSGNADGTRGVNRLTLAANNESASALLRNFIDSQRGKCGEIPCSVPPCCGKTCSVCRN